MRFFSFPYLDSVYVALSMPPLPIRADFEGVFDFTIDEHGSALIKLSPRSIGVRYNGDDDDESNLFIDCTRCSYSSSSSS